MNQDKHVVATLDDGRIVLVNTRPEEITAGRLVGKVVAVWHDETGDESAPRCGKDGE